MTGSRRRLRRLCALLFADSPVLWHDVLHNDERMCDPPPTLENVKCMQFWPAQCMNYPAFTQALTAGPEESHWQINREPLQRERAGWAAKSVALYSAGDLKSQYLDSSDILLEYFAPPEERYLLGNTGKLTLLAYGEVLLPHREVSQDPRDPFVLPRLFILQDFVTTYERSPELHIGGFGTGSDYISVSKSWESNSRHSCGGKKPFSYTSMVKLTKNEIWDHWRDQGSSARRGHYSYNWCVRLRSGSEVDFHVVHDGFSLEAANSGQLRESFLGHWRPSRTRDTFMFPFYQNLRYIKNRGLTWWYGDKKKQVYTGCGFSSDANKHTKTGTHKNPADAIGSGRQMKCDTLFFNIQKDYPCKLIFEQPGCPCVPYTQTGSGQSCPGNIRVLSPSIEWYDVTSGRYRRPETCIQVFRRKYPEIAIDRYPEALQFLQQADTRNPNADKNMAFGAIPPKACDPCRIAIKVLAQTQPRSQRCLPYDFQMHLIPVVSLEEPQQGGKPCELVLADAREKWARRQEVPEVSVMWVEDSEKLLGSWKADAVRRSLMLGNHIAESDAGLQSGQMEPIVLPLTAFRLGTQATDPEMCQSCTATLNAHCECCQRAEASTDPFIQIQFNLQPTRVDSNWRRDCDQGLQKAIVERLKQASQNCRNPNLSPRDMGWKSHPKIIEAFEYIRTSPDLSVWTPESLTAQISSKNFRLDAASGALNVLGCGSAACSDCKLDLRPLVPPCYMDADVGPMKAQFEFSVRDWEPGGRTCSQIFELETKAELQRLSLLSTWPLLKTEITNKLDIEIWRRPTSPQTARSSVLQVAVEDANKWKTDVYSQKNRLCVSCTPTCSPGTVTCVHDAGMQTVSTDVTSTASDIIQPECKLILSYAGQKAFNQPDPITSACFPNAVPPLKSADDGISWAGDEFVTWRTAVGKAFDVPFSSDSTRATPSMQLVALTDLTNRPADRRRLQHRGQIELGPEQLKRMMPSLPDCQPCQLRTTADLPCKHSADAPMGSYKITLTMAAASSPASRAPGKACAVVARENCPDLEAIKGALDSGQSSATADAQVIQAAFCKLLQQSRFPDLDRLDTDAFVGSSAAPVELVMRVEDVRGWERIAAWQTCDDCDVSWTVPNFAECSPKSGDLRIQVSSTLTPGSNPKSRPCREILQLARSAVNSEESTRPKALTSLETALLAKRDARITALQTLQLESDNRVKTAFKNAVRQLADTILEKTLRSLGRQMSGTFNADVDLMSLSPDHRYCLGMLPCGVCSVAAEYKCISCSRPPSDSNGYASSEVTLKFAIDPAQNTLKTCKDAAQADGSLNDELKAYIKDTAIPRLRDVFAGMELNGRSQGKTVPVDDATSAHKICKKELPDLFPCDPCEMEFSLDPAPCLPVEGPVFLDFKIKITKGGHKTGATCYDSLSTLKPSSMKVLKALALVLDNTPISPSKPESAYLKRCFEAAATGSASRDGCKLTSPSSALSASQSLEFLVSREALATQPLTSAPSPRDPGTAEILIKQIQVTDNGAIASLGLATCEECSVTSCSLEPKCIKNPNGRGEKDTVTATVSPRERLWRMLTQIGERT
uniref:Uncharacterized protein n=1 Tax=Chromera velia CCMP2878 TaxID=1169474 RepID=A0A0G4FDK4_9ALVE|eukprot:Cvel_16382.t1-p1 / transcript=Cvel_16382.t1 / gene=Cvel_16382 / organism=Chromera_velia_CCMP2878 / gene_product=hypothetical protein / transcript_product=hypothetical protein / location=Cvel_scaffold1260:11050-21594(-) / protein_length=1570 / sequence_SO=supercontig / SO=protein_coding / is_pseudo=false